MADPFQVYVERDVRDPDLDYAMGLDPLLDDPGIEVTFIDDPDREEIRPSDLAGADAFVSFADPITAASLDGVEGLRVIARMGAGYDNLDLDAITDHGVVAVHAPQGPTESVAQAALGMLVVCAHNLKVYDTVIRESGFEERAAHRGFELGSATVGIIGTGLIGSRLAELLRPFDTDLQIYDPYIPDERIEELGGRRVDFDEVLETSDLVSLHVPRTEETIGMLGTEQFEQMKETAYLVNTTRGGIYPDAELAAAVRDGEIAGAAIDVFEDEPDVEGNPLLDLDEVLVTPHITGVTHDSAKRIGNYVSKSILRIRDGELPINILNPDVYDEPVPEENLSPSFQ